MVLTASVCTDAPSWQIGFVERGTAKMTAKTGKITDFRLWLQHRWQDHCTEFDNWFKRRPEMTSEEYFRKYRWWLRQEFRRQR